MKMIFNSNFCSEVFLPLLTLKKNDSLSVKNCFMKIIILLLLINVSLSSNSFLNEERKKSVVKTNSKFLNFGNNINKLKKNFL